MGLLDVASASRRWAIQLVISLISCAIMPQDSVFFFFFFILVPISGFYSTKHTTNSSLVKRIHEKTLASEQAAIQTQQTVSIINFRPPSSVLRLPSSVSVASSEHVLCLQPHQPHLERLHIVPCPKLSVSQWGISPFPEPAAKVSRRGTQRNNPYGVFCTTAAGCGLDLDARISALERLVQMPLMPLRRLNLRPCH